LKLLSAVPFRAAAIAATHPSAASPFEQHTRNPAMQANKHYSFIMRPVFNREHRALIFLAARLLNFLPLGLFQNHLPFHFTQIR